MYQHNALTAKPAWWGVDILLPSLVMVVVILWVFPWRLSWQVLSSAVFAASPQAVRRVQGDLKWKWSGLNQRVKAFRRFCCTGIGKHSLLLPL